MNDFELREKAEQMLKERGVTIEQMAELTLFLQKKYVEDLTLEECIENVSAVLNKREVQNTIFTGITLDKLAEENLIDEPLNSMLKSDYGLYGVDEILALSIVNVYGSIGFTNYGYVDKLKPGILKVIDDQGKSEKNVCNTFLDDIVGAIAAAAASRIAHNTIEKE